MSGFRVHFGHENSVGVLVDAPTEREARVAAMDVLRENRGVTKWNSRQYLNWEDKIGNVIYEFKDEFSGMALRKEDGEAVFAGPPKSPDFGQFPPIVKVTEI